MLASSLAAEPDLEPQYFTLRHAILRRFDVLHLHWPESHLRGRTAFRTIARQALFTLILVKARVLGRPIVRTVHNVEFPRGISIRERWILQLCERWTVLRIRMNEQTPIPDGQPSVIISHGHYREWFGSYARPQQIPGRIAFFGLVRRYKGVRQLADAFCQTRAAQDGLTLHISGHPSSAELADELRNAAGDDDRIWLRLERIDDAELVAEVSEAELIVLPYPEMHNSGAVLTTLSLDRPVLVPDNVVNRRLQVEVGREWVFCYAPPLTGSQIIQTLVELRALGSVPRPNLDQRDWAISARSHHEAYLHALDIVAAGRQRGTKGGRRRPTPGDTG